MTSAQLMVQRTFRGNYYDIFFFCHEKKTSRLFIDVPEKKGNDKVVLKADNANLGTDVFKFFVQTADTCEPDEMSTMF